MVRPLIICRRPRMGDDRRNNKRVLSNCFADAAKGPTPVKRRLTKAGESPYAQRGAASAAPASAAPERVMVWVMVVSKNILPSPMLMRGSQSGAQL
jgi:hypothetical protein